MKSIQLKKSNAKYLAIWNDLSPRPFLPLEEQIENEVGAYAALRHAICSQEDEDKKVELINSLREWLGCQLHTVDKYLGYIEPDAKAVFEASFNKGVRSTVIEQLAK